MAIATSPDTTAPGWLRSRSFDLTFIVGVAALAIASGWLVVNDPRLFAPILLLDLWLLGYHHVIATYTRLCFDRVSFREHRFLLFGLPFLVLGATVALAYGIGLWTLTTIYLYWQWFHYTRQSYGISKAYKRKSGAPLAEDDRLAVVTLYLTPLWGILYRSNQAPETFLWLELRVIPVPDIAVQIAGVLAAAAFLWWFATRLYAWLQGRLPLAHSLYLLSHHLVFFVGYVLIQDITYGWLVINIWHNAQYVLFVWLYNTKRFEKGVTNDAKFLSTISQRQWAVGYFLICIAISTVVYLGIQLTANALAFAGVIVIYQTINFHHYIVDSVIWKMRRPALRQTLGLTSTR